ncbi:MAG: hypothetical protein IJN55_03740 [Alistipes sp.]|nr:hypothetical protein [Alistipes sp.]
MKKSMKNLFTLLLASMAMTPLMAQTAETAKTNLPQIPISVYLPEEAVTIPAASRQALEAKLLTATAQCGMGATEDFAQFYVTCSAQMVDEQVLPGAPTKYRQEVEWSLYVVDAFAKKIFGSTVISTRGVGNSPEKAYNRSLRQISASLPDLQRFFTQMNTRIIDYYESQCDNIITMAQTLAGAYKYEEALFRLAVYPEACPSYPRIVEVAVEIFKKYRDDQALRNLAQARSIWAAGQDAAAARAAAPYLAEILPDASCYEEAMALLKEIKTRVKEDIDYLRAIEERNNRQSHEQAMAQINSWQEVGVAYGTNQKQTIYRDAWPWK